MAQAKKSRAFIIGDKDNGLTIVVTDPVMVVHYSVDDLKNAAVNQMNAQDPIVSMAAVVQDVLPLLRGVDVVQMRTAASDMANSAHGSYSLSQEANLLGEIDYARTIGQIIRRNRMMVRRTRVSRALSSGMRPLRISSSSSSSTSPTCSTSGSRRSAARRPMRATKSAGDTGA